MQIGAALLGAVAFGLYLKVYLPHQLYFDSGQWWKDIVTYVLYLVTVSLVVFFIVFSISKYRQAKQMKAEVRTLLP